MDIKVLAMDDSLTIRKVIESTLKNDGYEIHTAVDGEEGVQKAYELMPDIILIDFLMPKMNGYQVCKKLRKDQQFQKTPIILITGKGEDVGKTFSERFTVDYFIKPFKPAQLLDKIKKVAANIKKTDSKPSPVITKPPQKMMEPAPPLQPTSDSKFEIKTPSIGIQPQKFGHNAITPSKPSEESTFNLQQLFEAGPESIENHKGQPIEITEEEPVLQLEELFLDKPAKGEPEEQGIEGLEFEEQPALELEELTLLEPGEVEALEQGIEGLEFEEQPALDLEELTLLEPGEVEALEQGLEGFEFEEQPALELEELTLLEPGEVEALEQGLEFEEQVALDDEEIEPGEIEALEQGIEGLEFEEQPALELEELTLLEPGEIEALEQGLEFEEQVALDDEEIEPGEVEALEQGLEGLEFEEQPALELEELTLPEPGEVEALEQGLEFEEQVALDVEEIELGEVEALEQEAKEVEFEEEAGLEAEAVVYEPKFAEEVILRINERINELLINFEKNLSDKMEILLSKTLNFLSSDRSGASLSGDFLKFSVSNILHLLMESNREGILYIISSDELTEIFIRGGKIVNFNTGEGRKWSTLFVDLKREFDLSDQQIAEAFENAIIMKSRLERVLIDRGHISVDGIKFFYIKQAKSDIKNLINIKQGRFFFKDTDVESDEFSLNMSFDELISL